MVSSINRIRLEFKGTNATHRKRRQKVLIESDWNLKFFAISAVAESFSVLIESDWNLKVMALYGPVKIKDRINRIRLEFKERSAMEQEKVTVVLIESDWNLKPHGHEYRELHLWY